MSTSGAVMLALLGKTLHYLELYTTQLYLQTIASGVRSGRVRVGHALDRGGKFATPLFLYSHISIVVRVPISLFYKLRPLSKIFRSSDSVSQQKKASFYNGLATKSSN